MTIRFCVPLLLFGMWSCEANSPSADASTLGYTIADTVDSETVKADAADTDTPDALPAPITHCNWAAGTWILTNCAGDQYTFSLVRTLACNYQIVSAAPRFAQGIVAVSGSAIEMRLNQSTCLGVFDGAKMVGACALSNGPCSFEATPGR